MRTRRPSRAGSERPSPETTPSGDGPGQAHRVTHRHDELADAQFVGVAQRRRGRARAVHADDGEVGERVDADHVEPGLGAVGEVGGAAARAGDHMGVGEQEPVVGEGDRRAGAVPARGADRQGGDGRQEAGGDAGHDTAVGIECLGFDTRVFGIHALQNAGPSPSMPVRRPPRAKRDGHG
nr:hypothetical protein GCM10020092_097520 [Actinoplanes digitatis]